MQSTGQASTQAVSLVRCRVSVRPTHLFKPAESVLKCGYGTSEQRSHRETTDRGRDSADGRRVCNQRHAGERVLPQPRDLAKYSGSSSEKTTCPGSSGQGRPSVPGGRGKSGERELGGQQRRVGNGVEQRTQDRSEPGLRCGHTGAPADGIGQGVGRCSDLGQRRGSTWRPEPQTCAKGLMVCMVWCATIWPAIRRAAMSSCSRMRGAIV